MATGKEPKTNLSSSPFRKLTDDLLIGVLIRLRYCRSACRCKTVCKRWNSIISDPYFSRRFVAHNKNRSAAGEKPPPHLRSAPAVHRRIFTFLPMPVPFPSMLGFFLLDCFKDLLLLGFPFSPTTVELARTFMVCNPFTEQWVALPLAPHRPMTLPHDIVPSTAARLVCDPCVSARLDSGEEAFTHHFEYRFRVVLMYESESASSKLDVFCSESGEWTAVNLDLRGRLKPDRSLVSVNGKLYWRNRAGQVIGWNPFSLDVEVESLPPGVSDPDQSELSFCFSQDALYMFRRSGDVLGVFSRHGGQGWRAEYQVPLRRGIKRVSVVGQHPEKSEIVFLQFSFTSAYAKDRIYSLNLRTRVPKFFAKDYSFQLGSMVFPQLWPTPIPNYEKLRGSYDGSYKEGWLQSSNHMNPKLLHPCIFI
ncbi:unnamed protein product [Linum trigynum]|uniref:F-box domain-containing protein n=1 Tax=Linum trigynum TaxID=586398 RepID=A0AAV2FKI6_9ROSI